MNSYFEKPNIQQLLLKKSSLQRLINANVCIFMLLLVIDILAFLTGTKHNPLIPILEIPATPAALAVKPWSAITYMFTHHSFWHLVFNMIWLWIFGRLFVKVFNDKKLFILYIIGGLLGAWAYITTYNRLDVFEPYRESSSMIGASASIMAITTAVACAQPKKELRLLFLGAIEIRWIALAAILFSVLGIPNENPGGNISHLGGALAGWGFATLLNRQEEKDTTSQPQNPFRDMSDKEHNRLRRRQESEMDRILDKVRKSGYESLSAKEKKKLFKMNQ